MGGWWLEGGSVVSWAGLLAVRQVEEGGTRMDLDDDDDAMDIESDEDNAIVHATAGGIPPPRRASCGGQDEAPVARQ